MTPVYYTLYESPPSPQSNHYIYGHPCPFHPFIDTITTTSAQVYNASYDTLALKKMLERHDVGSFLPSEEVSDPLRDPHSGVALGLPFDGVVMGRPTGRPTGEGRAPIPGRRLSNDGGQVKTALRLSPMALCTTPKLAPVSHRTPCLPLTLTPLLTPCLGLRSLVR